MHIVVIKNLFLVLTCIGLDQIFKFIAVSELTFHKNYGVVMGFFSTAPTAFRIVTLSTFAGFLLCSYFMLLYLLPNRMNFLKTALSLIISGVCGNIIDRLINNFTIDFIPIKLAGIDAYYNLADIFLIVGVGYFIFCIFKYENKIWHPNSTRGNYLVNPKEQLVFALKFCLASTITSIIMGLYSFTFIKSFFTLHGSNLLGFIIIFGVISLLICLLTFLLGVIISHRSAGPLYAFENYVERLLQGENKKFSLRDGDNHKHLEEVAEKLRNHFHKD